MSVNTRPDLNGVAALSPLVPYTSQLVTLAGDATALGNIADDATELASLASQETALSNLATDATALGNLADNATALNNLAPHSAELVTFANTLDIVASANTPPSGSADKGDVAINTNPDLGEPVAWTCIVAGNPGTWKAIEYVPNPITSTSTSLALTNLNDIVYMNHSAPSTVTLPTAANMVGYENKLFTIKDVSNNASTNNITFAAGSGTTLETATTITDNRGWTTFSYNGTVWRVVSKTASGGLDYTNSQSYETFSNTVFNTTSTSFVDVTGSSVSAVITKPSIVTVTFTYRYDPNDVNNTIQDIQLVRDSTVLRSIEIQRANDTAPVMTDVISFSEKIATPGTYVYKLQTKNRSGFGWQLGIYRQQNVVTVIA